MAGSDADRADSPMQYCSYCRGTGEMQHRKLWGFRRSFKRESLLNTVSFRYKFWIFPNGWRELKLSPQNNNYQNRSLPFCFRKANPVVLSLDMVLSIMSLIWNSHSRVRRDLLQVLLMLLTVSLVITGRYNVTEWKGKPGSLYLVFCCCRNHFRNLLRGPLKGVRLRLPGCFVSELMPKSQKSSNSESHFI